MLHHLVRRLRWRMVEQRLVPSRFSCRSLAWFFVVVRSFDEVAGLSGLSFALKGVAPGKVHRVTRAATTRKVIEVPFLDK